MSTRDNLPPLYSATYDHIGIILWGLAKFQRVLATQFRWLARYPSFKLGLDHEAYTYDYLAAHAPATLRQLRGALRRFKGRLGIGACTYGQPLSMFISEESNIRQLTLALQTCEERLGYPITIYLVSEHAFHAQLPQLLLGCGFRGAVLRTHFMMYGHNPQYDHPVGLWVGVDGSRIPALPTYNGQLSAPLLSQRIPGFASTVDNRILTDAPSPQCRLSLADFRERFAGSIRPLIATRADDVRNREELIQVHQGDPDYRWILAEEIFDILPTPRAQFNAAPNDFRVRMPWGYCGSWMWRQTRRAEAALLTAERLAALAACQVSPKLANPALASSTPGALPAALEARLEQAWKDLLVAQHHDIQICGLEDDARRFLGAALSGANAVCAASFEALASPGSPQAAPGNPLAAPENLPSARGHALVFNPLPWEREEVISLPDQAGDSPAAEHLVRLPGLAVGQVELNLPDHTPPGMPPSFTWQERATTEHLRTPFKVLPDQTRERGWGSEEMARLTTPYYEVFFHPQGGMRLLLDRRVPSEVDPVILAPPKTSGTLAAMINGVDCVSTAGSIVVEPAVSGCRVVERGEIGGIPYCHTWRFYHHTPRIDWRGELEFSRQWIGRPKSSLPPGAYHFDREDLSEQIVPAFHEHEFKLRLRFFPRLAPHTWGVRDLPFHAAETDEMYVQGNYWTAVTDGSLGLALLNQGLMGSVRESDGAFSSVLAFSLPYVWGTRVLEGAYTYELGIFPFRGDWRKADVHRQALAYNFPFVAHPALVTAPLHHQTHPAWSPFRDRGDGKAILSALYTRGGKTYARFYEPHGQGALVAFDWLGKPACLAAVDLREREQGGLGDELPLSPWQVQTVRIE